jgi:cell division cycle protein 37
MWQSDEESMSKFWKDHKKEMQEFGMLTKSEASLKFLQEHPHLVNEHLANYLAIWSIDLCVEEVCVSLCHPGV